ncbi:hypothetical protein [Xanthomonas bonasiae]|uniref:hypothetical protein n=1 Tax=Xanthomonas bonasiae TaxID=2810351 RepID=UPI001CD88A16|nr:hypothetical protein [Xanthomonas surreyensis]
MRMGTGSGCADRPRRSGRIDLARIARLPCRIFLAGACGSAGAIRACGRRRGARGAGGVREPGRDGRLVARYRQLGGPLSDIASDGSIGSSKARRELAATIYRERLGEADAVQRALQACSRAADAPSE